MTNDELDKTLHDLDTADYYDDYIKAFNTAKSALEKQIPKNIRIGFNDRVYCPCCSWWEYIDSKILDNINYCPNCGQRLETEI